MPKKWWKNKKKYLEIYSDLTRPLLTEYSFFKGLTGGKILFSSVIDGENIVVEAELFSLDGSKRFYEKKIEKIEKFREIGKEIGQILKTKSNNSYKR